MQLQTTISRWCTASLTLKEDCWYSRTNARRPVNALAVDFRQVAKEIDYFEVPGTRSKARTCSGTAASKRHHTVIGLSPSQRWNSSAPQ
jgi:hypothetical protein